MHILMQAWVQKYLHLCKCVHLLAFVCIYANKCNFFACSFNLFLFSFFIFFFSLSKLFYSRKRNKIGCIYCDVCEIIRTKPNSIVGDGKKKKKGRKAERTLEKQIYRYISCSRREE